MAAPVGEAACGDDWDEWGGDEGFESASAAPLLGGKPEQSAAAALAVDRARGLDLRAERARLALDVYGTVRLVNFVRACVRDDPDGGAARALAAVSGAAPGGTFPWAGDEYLAPVLEDDALLFDLYGEDSDEEAEGEGAALPDESVPAALPPQLDSAAFEARRREELLATARAAPAELAQLAAAQLTIGGGASGSAGPGAAPALLAAGGGDADDSDSDDGAKGEGKGKGGGARRRDAAKRAGARENDDEAERDSSYFDSYSHFGIHRTMLGDYVRTRAYEEALTRNPSLMRGAKVLDVGCGTGVLSCFAARGGAARVVGVDGSAFIAERAEGVIAENGLAETVGVVRGRIEELSDAAVLGVADGAEVREEDKFDVIVSEWMGYGLLFECMLDSVIVARDRWLKRGGAVLPDVARILVAGGSALAADLPFWDEVHGLSMGTIRQELRKAALKEALVRPVDAQAIVTAPQLVRSLDLSTMSVADTTFTSDFRLSASMGGGVAPDGAAAVSAVVLWFDTDFSARFCADKSLVLSTSPLGPQTHWVQTVLVLDEDVHLAVPGREVEAQGAAHHLCGKISFSPGKGSRCRSMDIVLEWWTEGGASGTGSEHKIRMYPL